jgi:hypothetical protein
MNISIHIFSSRCYSGLGGCVTIGILAIKTGLISIDNKVTFLLRHSLLTRNLFFRVLRARNLT